MSFPHTTKDPRFNVSPWISCSETGIWRFFEKMKALICNALCFSKTENNRFQPNSGGVFLTQRIFSLSFNYFTYLLKVNHTLYCNSNATALFTILVITIMPLNYYLIIEMGYTLFLNQHVWKIYYCLFYLFVHQALLKHKTLHQWSLEKISIW